MEGELARARSVTRAPDGTRARCAGGGRFRGEFIGLSGGADFYAETILALAAEGRASLRVYLDLCREKGVEPFRGDRSHSPDDQVD